MRKWASLGVVVAALVAPGGARADHHTPAAVYTDFAEDGVLSCGHPRAALKGVLNDASIHQYGDPLALIGVKLAIRKQLAHGCRRTDRAPVLMQPPESGNAGRSARKRGGTAPGPAQKPKRRTNERTLSKAAPRTAGATPDAGRDGRLILLGIALLLLTLGSGGWAAKRALDDKR